MITYKKQKNRDGTEAPIIARLHEDGRIYFIPLEGSSPDLREYQEWLDAGNEPLPADEL